MTFARRLPRALAALSVAAAANAFVGCGEDGGRRDPEGPAPAPTPARGGDLLALAPLACKLAAPVQVLADPARRGGLLVVERAGVIRSLRRCAERSPPRPVLLDIRDLVATEGEQGLLSVALHPRYPRDPRIFVHHSDREGDTVVAGYEVRDGRAIEASRRVLLEVDQPYDNHNGGTLAFGADGRLYLGLGDGGAAFDPQDRSQDPDSRLGKLLRYDAARPGPAKWDAVASGLRNPWRFSFDGATGDLWIGDVGQDRSEEVDLIDRASLERAGPARPLNLGWPAYEGRERMPGRRLVGRGPLVFPVATYGRRQGCSIVGGFVYRGSANPGLRGRYVYGDLCSGRIWTLRRAGSRADVRVESEAVPQLVAFGEDAERELYAVSLDGSVVRLTEPRRVGRTR